MASVLLALLGFSTVRNASRDQALIRHNALSQGYWIARSLEIGHRLMLDDHVNALREIVAEVEQKPDIQFVIVLDAAQRVMIASDVAREGTRWPDALGEPPETGRIMRSRAGAMELVFPAFFARTFQRLHTPHPNAPGKLDEATWVLLRLDVSEELAHYRASVIQSVGVSLSVVVLGLAAFWFFGMIQRYRLANASLEQLEQIKHHLARFVPGTVQKLIEENPEQPSLDKVEREVTILFLDIDHYTTMAAEMTPEALNRLIEMYFSSFLDIILSHGGDINETAGDGIMAIFTGKKAHVHARNAVKAAIAIRAKARALNRDREPQRPEIVVNIGINTGHVLLGATMMRGAVGERLTYTASGMVTNLAARLCEFGAKGAIHLSDTTAKFVSDHCILQSPLEVNLKHIEGVTLAYKVA
jgi:class 3 adenylate cyclase